MGIEQQAKFNCLILLPGIESSKHGGRKEPLSEKSCISDDAMIWVCNLFFQSRLPIYSQMPHFQNIINVMNSGLLAASKLTNISYRLEKDY